MSIHFCRRAAAFDDPFRLDFKSGQKEILDFLRNALDFANRSVEIFQIVDHLGIPKIESFELFDEIRVCDCEFSG